MKYHRPLRNLISTFIASVRVPVKNEKIALGRWNRGLTKEQLERRISLANSDNCYYCDIKESKIKVKNLNKLIIQKYL